jgi:hypothetical protein
MLSNALFWSGHQLCWALTSVGVDESSLSACNENQRVMGFLIVAWAAVMIIVWKLMLGRIK